MYRAYSLAPVRVTGSVCLHGQGSRLDCTMTLVCRYRLDYNVPCSGRLIHCWYYKRRLCMCVTSSSFGFSRQGPPQIFHLHLFLSPTSSYYTSTTVLSSLTASINLHSSGRPCFLFPGSFILCIRCPNTYHISSVHVQTTSILPLVFVSNPSHLRCPFDVLIPDLVN